MKIVHLSAYDSGGVAAKSAYRLHEWMIGQGYESTFVVRKKRINDSRTIQWGGNKSWFSILKFKLTRKFKYKGESLYQNLKSVHQSFAFDFRSPDVKPDFNISGDILQVHWIIGFLDFNDIVRISRNFKYVVWRFSDLNPVTGGCVYNNTCNLFNAGCEKCPIDIKPYFQQLVEENYQIKKENIERLQDKLTVISQSAWMKKAIERSRVFSGINVLHIPNGLLINELSKGRKEISIEDSLKVFSVSAGFDSERKGGMELMALWAQHEKNEKMHFSVAGSFKVRDGLTFRNIKFLGHLGKDNLYAEYQNSDLLLFLNKQDNFPNVLLEAGMHGLPVIAFQVDGVTDIIIDGYNGWLFEYGDITGISQKLIELSADKSLLEEVGMNARKRIEENYDINIQGNRYIDLYKEKLKFANKN